MAEIYIFEDEAFSVQSLLATINEEHPIPGQIAASGLFTEEGSTTVTQQIEKDGDVLELVAAAPRGAPGQVVIGSKRQMIPFNCVHLPQEFTIMADEIQGIRAFGSRTELQGVQDVVNTRLNKVRGQLDLTHEYQRIGAIKGQVLDKDGTILVDLFQMFGIKQQKLKMDFGTTDVSVRTGEALDMQEDALGNVTGSGAIAWCGKNFWADLIADDSVKETYLNHEAAAALRGDRRQAIGGGSAYGITDAPWRQGALGCGQAREQLNVGCSSFSLGGKAPEQESDAQNEYRPEAPNPSRDVLVRLNSTLSPFEANDHMPVNLKRCQPIHVIERQ